MTFAEFLNQYNYLAWFLNAIIFIVIVVYAVRFYLDYRKGKKVKVEEKTELPSQEEFISMLKEIEKQKPKKAEARIRVDKKIKKEKPKEEVIDTVIKPYSPIKSKKKTSVAYWKEWFLDKYFTGKIVLINMELTNGFHRTFTVIEKEEGFVFKGKKYLFDDENKYYNIDAKLYQFDYHEGITLPIKRKIPVTEIKKTMESTEGIDIEYAINPSTLQRFMTAKIAEGVMKGTQLDEFLRKLQMYIIVIMVAVLVHFALFLYASGILRQIQLPF